MNGHLESESEDYDLEYRANEDEPWYSVCVVLDVDAQKLTVKYCSSPEEEYKVVFTAGEFATEAEVDELTGRFRPVSLPLEDHECGKLSIGTTVCAAHALTDDDLRFYDAAIEAVERRPHSFADGEEECLCNFVLFWKNGRGRGKLTTASIATICIAEPATQHDPRISAFALMAKKKITSSDSVFTRKKNTESSQNRSPEMGTSMTQKSLMLESEAGLGKMRNYNEWTSQDEDMGSGCINTEFILICNLENDLTPSSIKDFIYKHTTILPQAFVFPRLLSDPFARGAIMVDSQKKVQIIYEFLENPNHIVVSSSGRPWVTEKASVGTFGANIWNLIPMMDESKYKRTDAKRTDKELQVVLSGAESYNKAKQLKDLLVEYIYHESQLCKRFVLEEEKIWRSCQPA